MLVIPSEVKGKELVLVMEKGNKDFAAILNAARAKKDYTIPHFTIQHYWAGMLLAVQQIHQHGRDWSGGGGSCSISLDLFIYLFYSGWCLYILYAFMH